MLSQCVLCYILLFAKIATAKLDVSPKEGFFKTGMLPGDQNFEGLERVSLGVLWVQNSIITTEVIISEPDRKILEICSAVSSKNGFMSILDFHKLYIDWKSGQE